MKGAPARLATIVAALAVVAVALSPQAQEGLRVVYAVDRDRSTAAQTQVSGTVFNDAMQDVLDVYVTAEALDARGKVVARGIAHVGARIPGGGSAAFVCKIPAAAGTVRYRAGISSFRSGVTSQVP